MSGDHPGPPPRRQTCHHEGAVLTWTWRTSIRRGKSTRTKIFQFDCLQCGIFGCKPGVRTTRGLPCHAGERRCLELLGADPRQAIERPSREEINRLVRSKYSWWDWYNRYLLSSAWAAKRAQVLTRDNWGCRICRRPATQVHHVTYDRVGYEDPDDLIAVCRDCHALVHGAS